MQGCSNRYYGSVVTGNLASIYTGRCKWSLITVYNSKGTVIKAWTIRRWLVNSDNAVIQLLRRVIGPDAYTRLTV